jgi:serine/threonine protein kinase
LAARNCLVEQNGDKLLRLKIGDFGLAKYIGDSKMFKVTNATQMPVAWSAIESLEKFEWTIKSDVWSMGVMIWEVSEYLPIDFPLDLSLTSADPGRWCGTVQRNRNLWPG